MKKRFVVVGASAASISFITKLRSTDKDSEIICISGEKDIPYNRCLLADFISQGKTLQEMQLKPETFFQDNNINLRLDTWVTKIDTNSNQLFVCDEVFLYDYLFLGTGTHPFIPNVGVDTSTPGIFTFHTVDDVQKLTQFIDDQKPTSMVVIGGGINGVECASALHDRNVSVGIVERCSQLLPLQIDQELGDYVKSIAQHKGVSLFLDATVQQVCVVDGVVQGVKLDSGALIKADGIVFATGSKVNSKLLEGTKIKTIDGSIVVDRSMKTSVDNVYAGGDICVVPDIVSKKLVKSATWSDAMLQGLCAGSQFSPRPRVYPGCIGLRDSHFFGYPFYGCGQTVDHDESIEVKTVTGMDSVTKLYLQDGVLKGFVLIGDISQVAEYKQKYLTQCSVEGIL